MDSEAPRLRIDVGTRLLVLTGAGVSAESGIPTFRDAGGLWEKHRVEDVASPRGFERDPALVWRFYSERRRAMADAAPNAGHDALAEVEARLGSRFLLATQNIDGLHTAAGSKRVIEIHGNLFQSRCSRCGRPPFEDRDVYLEKKVPGCGACHARGEFALLRPHIVWFGEALDNAHLDQIEAFLRESTGGRLVFLAIGTSGTVYPSAALVDAAKRIGGETWLVNVEAPDNVSKFETFVQGKSGEILRDLFSFE